MMVGLLGPPVRAVDFESALYTVLESNRLNVMCGTWPTLVQDILSRHFQATAVCFNPAAMHPAAASYQQPSRKDQKIDFRPFPKSSFCR